MSRLWIQVGLESSGLNLIRMTLYIGYMKDYESLSILSRVCQGLKEDLEPDRNRVVWGRKMRQTRRLIESFCTIPNVREGYETFRDIVTKGYKNQETLYLKRLQGQILVIRPTWPDGLFSTLITLATPVEAEKPTIQFEYQGISITPNNVYLGVTISRKRNDRLNDLLKINKHRPTPWILDYWGDGMWHFIV